VSVSTGPSASDTGRSCSDDDLNAVEQRLRPLFSETLADHAPPPSGRAAGSSFSKRKHRGRCGVHEATDYGVAVADAQTLTIGPTVENGSSEVSNKHMYVISSGWRESCHGNVFIIHGR
jgi:hypothetical protein